MNQYIIVIDNDLYNITADNTAEAVNQLIEELGTDRQTVNVSVVSVVSIAEDHKQNNKPLHSAMLRNSLSRSNCYVDMVNQFLFTPV